MGLDFDTMKQWGMEEPSHKRYLNDYFTGKIADSISRGELYNDDPVTQDARFCGTTASMCGIEAAGFEGNAEKMQTAIQEDLMLHAYMLTQSGIPMLYSGDELGQVNDYSYKEDAEKYLIHGISTEEHFCGNSRIREKIFLLYRESYSRC